MKKVGHGGTLDPMVNGVLPVFIGNATRAMSLIEDKEKEYVCTMTLGVSTDTEDLFGTVLERRPVNVSEEAVREAVFSFLGEYEQIPPMYSAKKIGGKKLYEAAREGLTVERRSERRFIREIELLHISLPEVTFRVVCSEGTYIRTLSKDIGEKLGTLGAMKSLTRTRHGRFILEEAHSLEEIEFAANEGRLTDFILPTEELFSSYVSLTVLPSADRFLQNGNMLSEDDLSDDSGSFFRKLPNPAGEKGFKIFFSNGLFAGLYRFSEETRVFRPIKMFL